MPALAVRALRQKASTLRPITVCRRGVRIRGSSGSRRYSAAGAEFRVAAIGVVQGIERCCKYMGLVPSHSQQRRVRTATACLIRARCTGSARNQCRPSPRHLSRPADLRTRPAASASCAGVIPNSLQQQSSLSSATAGSCRRTAPHHQQGGRLRRGYLQRRQHIKQTGNEQTQRSRLRAVIHCQCLGIGHCGVRMAKSRTILDLSLPRCVCDHGKYLTDSQPLASLLLRVSADKPHRIEPTSRGSRHVNRPPLKPHLNTASPWVVFW